MKKRILAFLMCLCLCVSLLPAAALADEAGSTSEPFTVSLTVNYEDSYTGEHIGGLGVYDENGNLLQMYNESAVIDVAAGEILITKAIEIADANMSSSWACCGAYFIGDVEYTAFHENGSVEITYTGGSTGGEGGGPQIPAGDHTITLDVTYPNGFEGEQLGGIIQYNADGSEVTRHHNDTTITVLEGENFYFAPIEQTDDLVRTGMGTRPTNDNDGMTSDATLADGTQCYQLHGNVTVTIEYTMSGGEGDGDAGSGFQWNGQTEVWSILPTTGVQGLIWITDAMGAAMEAEGWTYVKKDAQGNPMTQAQFFEDAVAAGNVGAIMCAAMDVNMLEEVAAAAYEAGIAVVYLGVEPRYSVAGSYYTAYDITGIFAVWAAENWVTNRVAEGGNVPTDPDGVYEVAIDTYYDIRDGVLRSNAVVETLDASGILTCVAETSSYGMDAYTTAYNNANAVLNANPNCHIFIAYESEMALGMADAIAEHCAENGLDLADYCVIPCYEGDPTFQAAYEAACADASASAVKGYATYGETPAMTGGHLAEIILSACGVEGYDHPFGATYYDPVWAANIYGWARSWQMGEDYPTMGGGSIGGGGEDSDLSGITIRFADEPEDHARPDGGLIGSSVLGEHYITVMVDGEPVTDFTVTSSDESVCTVKNDDGVLSLTALKYGAATLTITVDGVSAEFTWVSEPGPGPVVPDAIIVHDGEVFPEANAALQNEEITVTEISSDEDGCVLELSGSDVWMEVYTNDPDGLQAVLNDENTQVIVTYGFDGVDESELSETDAAALKALKQSVEPGMDSAYMAYVDLSAVLAVIDEEHGFGIYGEVQELSEAASFCMQVSKSALEAVGRDIRHLSVVRVHDGVAEKLWEFGDEYEETLDGYNLFFTTDRFSTYALMYDRVVGDINGDDIALDALDIVSMMKYVLGEGNTVVKGSVDVNGDGKDDILDLIRLMRKIAGEDVALN